jgi:D-glycero-beta-D-manno-heptose 1-phosphate adenylyltransferase
MPKASAKLSSPGVVSLKKAVEVRNALAKRGGTFVLTNGVFDLLHPGHTSYLEQARKLAGDDGMLFVALNSDASVRELKGPLRPILDQKSRAQNLARLRSVDGVVIFSGKRLVKEIKALGPDIYCKAGDYTLATLDPSERDALMAAGANVVFLPFLKGFSTTKMIERIRAAGSA